jgi:hypothetical protein
LVLSVGRGNQVLFFLNDGRQLFVGLFELGVLLGHLVELLLQHLVALLLKSKLHL